MTKLALNDDLLDAQLLRTIGQAPYRGADIGECLATASRIKGTDLGDWHAEWTATADRVRELAETEESVGHRRSARDAYLRASNYHRNAGVMLMGIPLDPRLKRSNELQTDCFRRASRLMDIPPEIVEIPFEDTTLPGYFFRAFDEERPRATVILTGGYDGTVEELYFYNAAAALERGYNVLAFDGPGQGSVLLQQGIALRPDWENVISPVVDFATQRDDVDSDRIALIGLSLGAHLAPRAAAGEHRLKACIADCGAFDLYQAFLDRLPTPLAHSFAEGGSIACKTVGGILHGQIKKPTAGWALRRGLLVHGKSDPLDLIDSMREFSLAGHAENITCPTWVARAEGDDISATADQLYESLTVDNKQLVEFTADEGADDHCESGARTHFHAKAFAWLDAILQPEWRSQPV